MKKCSLLLTDSYISIRTLLALANAYTGNLEVHQMDVKPALLNGIIEHEMFISQPQGFIDPDHPSMCPS